MAGRCAGPGQDQDLLVARGSAAEPICAVTPHLILIYILFSALAGRPNTASPRRANCCCAGGAAGAMRHSTLVLTAIVRHVPEAKKEAHGKTHVEATFINT